MTSAFAISQILVGGALVLNLLSFQFKKRAVVVSLLTLSTTLVAGQLYLLGQSTAALLVLFAVLYFLVSLTTTDRRVMICFMIGAAIIFGTRYSSWLDWFMFISSFFTLLSLYNSNQKRMREFQFVGTLTRIVYYSIIFSPVGIALEVALLVSNVTSYWRFHVRKLRHMRIRALGIVVKGDEVLLIHRNVHNQSYFVFPGGGVEQGETAEQGALREVYEEAGINAKLEKLVYRVTDENSEHNFYICSYISGELKSEQEEGDELSSLDSKLPSWNKIRDLASMKIMPLEVRDWLIEDFQNNFTDTPRMLHSLVSERRVG